MKKSEWIFAVVLLAIVSGIIFIASLMASYALPVQDLSQYWAAAHLFSKNPYSLDLLRSFERGSGIYSNLPATKTPPWAILLVLPLGLLGYHEAFAVWALMSVAIIGWCSFEISRGLFPDGGLAPTLISFIFGPTVVLLMLGQFTVLVLFGVILFCRFTRRRNDWLAGASLLLLCGKPHIVLLFLFAILLWVIHSKRWIVLISGSAAFTASSLLALLINPDILQQFRDRSLLVIHETESYPNLGGVIYEVSGVHFLAVLPQIAGILWVLWYWSAHRSEWVWEREGLFVLLISVTCSYYSYPYDQILALPALIIAYAVGNRRLFLLGFVLTNLGYAIYMSNIAGHFGYGYMFLWWTALGWLLSYLLSKCQFLRQNAA